ncbi:type II secretion system secretin GspD [Pseudomonadales bacterium]|nr:type II secretion system secretin GspD [Pseudomonadales bacterium]MDC1017356.1 type II secretion system secretin GspD [Pseudomonadales bacterium]|tara:strand:- start:7615 stop:9537 length:1923 start_codon:yes stop_codon:yes gene_type:complete
MNLVSRTTLMSLFMLKRAAISCLLIAGLASSMNTYAEGYSGTLNLKNADIREVVTQISAITGKSFIIDPRVKGNVTVVSNTKMDSDTTYELFLSVLRVHGYAAVPSGNVIRIVQQVLAKQSGNPGDFSDNTSSEELVTQVISVRNTASAELVKILRPLIPQYGHIAGLTSPNALIISDHASNIARLAEIVNRIDVVQSSTTEIVQLKEAWVEDMVALLEQLAPEQIGKGAKGPNKITLVASERTNSIVIKGDPGSISRVVALIQQLDIPANRAGTIQVVRLAHSDAAELAAILKELISQNGKGDKPGQDIATSIQADEALNALVIKADPSTMAELKDIIAKLDVRRLQVLIEAVIVEVTTTFNRKLGTEFSVVDAGSNVPLISTTNTNISNLVNSIATAAAGGATALPSLDSNVVGAGRLSETGSNFALLISALATNNNVDLLSTPSITTMDNEEAKIFVGQNVPFRTGSTTTGSNGTTNPFTTIQRQEVGLTLDVTPHVHDGSLIRLEISQEVSEVVENQNIGSAGSADLITSTSTIDTTVLADNNEIIILGGLIRNNTTGTENKVPFLGDIPVLGRLFKSTTTGTEKKNLMIFLRPTVLNSVEKVKEVTARKYSGVWEVEIEGTEPRGSLSDLFDGKH